MNLPHYVQVLTAADSQILPVDFSSHNDGSEKRVPRLVSFSCRLSFHRSIVMGEWILVGYPFLRLQIVFVSSRFEPFLTVASGNTECVCQPWSSGLVYQSGLGDVTSTHIVNKTHTLNDCLVGIEAVLLRCVVVSPEKKHPNCSQTYVRISRISYIYIFYLSTYVQGNIYVQHDYLRTDHHLPSLWGFSRRVPLFKTKIKKKVALKKGATRFRITAGHETRRDRHVSIVPSLCSAGGGHGDWRQIQNKAAVMKTIIEFILYNIQKYP